MNSLTSSHCIFFFLVYENYLSKLCHGSPHNIFQIEGEDYIRNVTLF